MTTIEAVGLVGAGVDRVDGPLKVTGAAPYPNDFSFENLAHAVLVRATIAAGWIRGIETAAAEAAPGVLGVITHENAPTLGRGTDPSGAPQLVPPLQDDRIVHYVQCVGVLVAETAEQATAAARLVEVDYVATEPVLDLGDPRAEVLANPWGSTTSAATSPPPWSPPWCSSTRPTRLAANDRARAEVRSTENSLLQSRPGGCNGSTAASDGRRPRAEATVPPASADDVTPVSRIRQRDRSGGDFCIDPAVSRKRANIEAGFWRIARRDRSARAALHSSSRSHAKGAISGSDRTDRWAEMIVWSGVVARLDPLQAARRTRWEHEWASAGVSTKL